MASAQPAPPNKGGTSAWSWYHSVISTYGSWLPGDARGYRTRHHRQHVEGDYKHPPDPDAFGDLAKVCRRSLKQPPVVLSATFRAAVAVALRQKLQRLGALVVAVSVSTQHAHILAKMPRGCARDWIGIAKRHAWFELRDRGWKGKLWARAGSNGVVRDRRHQLQVYHYILRHRAAGACVWKWGDAD
jgi:hypothetical protein